MDIPGTFDLLKSDAADLIVGLLLDRKYTLTKMEHHNFNTKANGGSGDWRRSITLTRESRGVGVIVFPEEGTVTILGNVNGQPKIHVAASTVLFNSNDILSLFLDEAERVYMPNRRQN
jgi:hypothetical protein